MAGVTPSYIIAQEAMSWLNTPFKEQKRSKGVACDCAGLIVGIGLAIDGFEADVENPILKARFGKYTLSPRPKEMTEALEIFLKPIHRNKIITGDVVYVDFGQRASKLLKIVPQHLGIVVSGTWGNDMKIVQAALQPFYRVVTHNMPNNWLKYIRRAYRYPSLQNWLDNRSQ